MNSSIIIYGATASGKSDFAISLANEINGVIINGDSAQIYKEFPILSNIPTPKDILKAPHKLFSIQSILDDFSVKNWIDLAVKEINLCYNKGKIPIIVSGSGMYLKSLIDGISNIPSSNTYKQIAQQTFNDMGYEEFLKKMSSLNPQYTNKFSDPQRLIRMYEVLLLTGRSILDFQKTLIKPIETNFIKFFLQKDRSNLYEDINQRFLKMINTGAIEEVEFFVNKHSQYLSKLSKILGASEINLYINKKISYEDLIHQAQTKSRHYAKRQLTWFNGMFSKTFNILESNNITKNLNYIKNSFNF
jgi:tRNA dimethylallyltransferase